MIDRELDLLHVRENFIGFTPVIGSLYGGRLFGLARMIKGRDLTDLLPAPAFVWIHVDDVGPLSTRSEKQRDTFDVPVYIRGHRVRLEVPWENVQALLAALGAAVDLIRQMENRPKKITLLRNSQAERFIAVNAQRVDETPLPLPRAERLHTPIP
jgi:hypothetical protein